MSVNSYYDNAVNGLFITAGMLQKPFFSSAYDMARNFGGVGAIMGHELTHGFDNTGRKYDQDSRLRDWWDKQVGAPCSSLSVPHPWSRPIAARADTIDASMRPPDLPVGSGVGENRSD